MNGTSVIGAGFLPNQGTAWQVKDDGPIPADQMAMSSPMVATSPPGNALRLSAPDPSAGVAAGLAHPTLTHLIGPT
jgi:hypothetical protein